MQIQPQKTNKGEAFSSEEMLAFLTESGILNMADVREAMRKKEIKEIVAAHPYEIYQTGDGRWRTQVFDDRKPDKRRKICCQDLDSLYEKLYNYYKGYDEQRAKSIITLDDLYPRWIKYKAKHTRADTYITRIESDWVKYYKGTPITRIPIRELKKLQLDEWAHSMIKKYDMTRKMYYNVTLIVRQALQYAVDLELIEYNPMDKVRIDGRRLFRHEKKKPNESQVYSREELAGLRELAWKDFYEVGKRKQQLAPLAVLFQFQTGLRIGEVCAVRYEDLINPDFITIQRMLRRDDHKVVEHTKGTCGNRDVILTLEAREIINACRERQLELGVSASGYIFSLSDKYLSYYAVEECYRKYCKALGIDYKSSHKARKTYISTLIDGDVNINTIREMVGHADERTTLGSYCYDRDSVKERIAKVEESFKK